MHTQQQNKLYFPINNNIAIPLPFGLQSANNQFLALHSRESQRYQNRQKLLILNVELSSVQSPNHDLPQLNTPPQIQVNHLLNRLMLIVYFLMGKIKIQLLIPLFRIITAYPKNTISLFKLIIFCLLLAKVQAAGIANCAMVSGSICLQCNDFYIQDADQKTCSLCLDNFCKTCLLPNSVNVCSVCSDGYVLSNYKCSICSVQYCQTCMSSMGTISCSVCISGYIMGGGGCQTCNATSDYCSTCSSLTTCTSCSSGYVLSSSSCILCNSSLQGCTQCSDASTCTQCRTDGYYLPLTATKCNLCSVKSKFINCAVCQYTGLSTCLTCNPNFMINGTMICDACSNVITNCMSCNTSQCLACDPGYILFGGNLCFPCDSFLSDCLNCNMTDCLSCQPTFFLQNSSACSLCASVLTNCTLCSNSQTCTECTTNNLVVNNGTSSICQPCSSAIQGCLQCDSANQCTNCDISSGYLLNSSKLCGMCNQSLPFCSICSDLSNCLSCINDQYGVNNLSQCQACQTLIIGCLTCSNSSYCTSCVSKEYQADNGSCILCMYSLFQCKECAINSLFVLECQKCQTGFHFNFEKKCVCDKGNFVDGYCLQIIGCIHVSAGPICTDCQQGMILNNGVCECPSNQWLVAQICTDIIGCVAIRQVNNSNSCIFCDLQKLFILGPDNKCHCKEYYELANQTCQQICGDGILLHFQCDDENLIDGDGCSSKCQIEAGFKCSVINGVKKCIYESKFTITLVKIEKLQNVNNGRFIFQFSPAVKSLATMNFSKYLNVSVPNADFTLAGSTYSKGFLYVNFDFGSNIQGLQATLTLNFDPKFFQVSPYNITFPIVSNGLQFTYLLKLQVYKVVKYMLFGLAVLTLLIFVASLPFHKMLGVQTLHTFQLFFIVSLIIDNYQEPFDCLLALKPTIGMINLWKYNTSVALNAKLLYNRLGVFKQFIQNQICISPLTISIAIIFLVYFIKYLSLARQEKKKNTLQQKLKIISSRIYKWLLFPIVVGFSLSSFLALYSETSKTKQWKNPLQINQEIIPSKANFIFIIAFCMIYSVIFWSQVLVPLKSITKQLLNVQKSKNWYVSQYLNYSFYTMFFLLGGYQISSKLSLLFLTVAVCIQFVVIIMKPPYKQMVHGAGVFINQLSLVVLSLSLLIRSLMIDRGHTFQQSSNFLFVLMYIAFLVLVDIVALIRIIYVIREKCTNTVKQALIPSLQTNNQNLREQMLKNFRDKNDYKIDPLQKRNKYLVENQIVLLKELEWKKNQEERIVHGLQPLDFSKSIFKRSKLRNNFSQQV